MRRYRKAKLVATLGPATSSLEATTLRAARACPHIPIVGVTPFLEVARRTFPQESAAREGVPA
jgi:hypothetical protein